MSGDYSRKHFKAQNNYSGVLEQQGRVHLDSEHNEASAIQDRRWRSESIDLIGGCGVSDMTPDAFRITVDQNGELQIGVGRIYVDGLQAENHGAPSSGFDPQLAEPHSEAAVPYLRQPYAFEVDADSPPPGPAIIGDVPSQAGHALVFLDVWQREVTHHQAPDLVETALGVDTTTRLQTVWQVKLLPVADNIELNCETPDIDIPGWDALRRPSDIRLTTSTSEAPTENDPCIVSPEGGYRGLDNLLYRVEVHEVRDGIPHIKWSRHNASIVAGVTHVAADRKQLTLDNVGRDDVLRFHSGDWVEITDDYRELLGLPGVMRRVQVNDAERSLSFDEAMPASEFPILDEEGRPDPDRHMRVIRWDQPNKVNDADGNPLDLSAPEYAGVIPIKGSSVTLPLEHGLRIKLDMPDDGIARTGDYWCFAVRTADASVEALDKAPPLGIHHHYCKLGVVYYTGDQFDEDIFDCRPRFPPLTQQFHFFIVGGDGQEAGPGQPLPQPLQVGVNNASRPVAGATVKFTIIAGDGQLAVEQSPPNRTLEVTTDVQGIASCEWRLDNKSSSQRVQATLIKADERDFVNEENQSSVTPLFFNARLETVQSRRGCRITVGEGGTFPDVDTAIKTLMGEGERDICLCLLPGDHESNGLRLEVEDPAQTMSLSISGCGTASRLYLQKGWLFRGLRAVSLRDLIIEPTFTIEETEVAVDFEHCREIRMNGCTLQGFTNGGPLLAVRGSNNVRLCDNLFEASTFIEQSQPLTDGEITATIIITSLSKLQNIFSPTSPDLYELFQPPTPNTPHWDAFRKKSATTAKRLAALKERSRHSMTLQLQDTLDNSSGLSDQEHLHLEELFTTLGTKNPPPPATLLTILLDLHHAAIKARPGLALVLGDNSFTVNPMPRAIPYLKDNDNLSSLENNEIAGITSLYGLPDRKHTIPVELLNNNFFKTLTNRVIFGSLGTLHLRGNLLNQITVSKVVIADIAEAIYAERNDNRIPIPIFSRSLIVENIFEKNDNVIISDHITLNSNTFTLTTPTKPPGSTESEQSNQIGIIISNDSIYIANRAYSPSSIVENQKTPNTNHQQIANINIDIKTPPI